MILRRYRVITQLIFLETKHICSHRGGVFYASDWSPGPDIPDDDFLWPVGLAMPRAMQSVSGIRTVPTCVHRRWHPAFVADYPRGRENVPFILDLSASDYYRFLINSCRLEPVSPRKNSFFANTLYTVTGLGNNNRALL